MLPCPGGRRTQAPCRGCSELSPRAQTRWGQPWAAPSGSRSHGLSVVLGAGGLPRGGSGGVQSHRLAWGGSAPYSTPNIDPISWPERFPCQSSWCFVPIEDPADLQAPSPVLWGAPWAVCRGLGTALGQRAATVWLLQLVPPGGWAVGSPGMGSLQGRAEARTRPWVAGVWLGPLTLAPGGAAWLGTPLGGWGGECCALPRLVGAPCLQPGRGVNWSRSRRVDNCRVYAPHPSAAQLALLRGNLASISVTLL